MLSDGEGVRADFLTADHEASFPPHDSKDVPQFAPNFTVYVLPPHVVCLYSEDRKFFLHGVRYYALGSAAASFASSSVIFHPTKSTKP